MNQKLVNEGDGSPALIAGTAVHAFLEADYSLPPEQRGLADDSATKRKLEALSAGYELDEPLTGTLEAMRQFCLKMEPLRGLDDSDKRSVHNLMKILKAYSKQYKDDGLTIYEHNGKKALEMRLEAVIHEDDELIIEMFGTVDAIFENKSNGLLFVGDHKTTSALGKEFFNRLNPNFQYTTYIWLANQHGINTNTFLVNGIQIAKTKQEFSRQFTSRTPEDFTELKNAVVFRVKEWLKCLSEENYPMSTPTSCGLWGGCTFIDACSVPPIIRQNVLKAKFPNA